MGQVGCPVDCARALEDRAGPWRMSSGSGRRRYNKGD